MQTKEEIRRLIKEKRDNLNKNQKQEYNHKLYKRIKEDSLFINAKNILFYVSFKNEADTKQLIGDNFAEKNIFVPKVNGNSIEIYKIDSFDDLEQGAFGILEPKQNTQKTNAEDIDLAFIPGVAFDSNGHRIGFGKGYYDILNKQLSCQKVGLAYNFQIVNNIPAESHDVPVDFIFTDSEKIKCN